MKLRKETTLMSDNTANIIVQDSREILLKASFSESETEHYVRRLIEILDDYTAVLGEGTEVQYRIWKSLVNVEFRMVIPGEPFDPFTEGSHAENHFYEKMYDLNQSSGASYRYVMKCNIISFSVPLAKTTRKLIKDPVIWGVILGIVCGLICRFLPAPVNAFLIDEIASPLQKVILSLISGVMGPVIVLSLISSIIALDSINDLTGLGFKIIGRFLLIILFLIGMSILMSGLIFRNFGEGGGNFSVSMVLGMLFDIVPTNLIEPILTNNTAQLVVLGLLAGAGLLLVGDGARELNKIIEQINKWVMSVMNIVLITTPAIPFLSMMITLAKGKEQEILAGWKFILASYLIFTVCTLIKGIKTSLKTGIGITELWNRVKPVAKVTFKTGSPNAALKDVYQMSDDLNIKKTFSSFWIPMSSAMLSPKTAVNVVIAMFMAASFENIPVSTAFLIVLIIMTTELSIASPGVNAACTVVLTSLGLPVDYVGLVSTYRLLTDNYGASCSLTYSVLEEIEFSHKLGVIETETSNNSEQ